MLEKYLKMSKQTEQELFAGLMSYDYDFIINELVPRALKENKKIVWNSDKEKLDLTVFELIPI